MRPPPRPALEVCLLWVALLSLSWPLWSATGPPAEVARLLAAVVAVAVPMVFASFAVPNPEDDAQARLRQSEALNRAVLSSLQAHIAVLDKDGTILAVNEAWERFGAENGARPPAAAGPGVSYLEVCRHVSGEFFKPAQEATAGILSVLNGAGEFFTQEYVCPHPSGAHWFMMRVTPLRRPEGGAVISHIDITARKRGEEALRQSEDRFRTLIRDLRVGVAL